MIKVEKEIKIVYKYNPMLVDALGRENVINNKYASFYEEVNKDLFTGGQAYLAQLKEAINKLFARQDILNLIAPNWVGMSKDDSRFVQAVQDKFLSTRITIDKAKGSTWNIGYTVDYTDTRRKVYYESLVREGKLRIQEVSKEGLVDIPPSQIEKDIVRLIDLDKISQEDVALYATPLDIEAYIRYLYAIYSKEVATISTYNKSPNINFVMIDPVTQERSKIAKLEEETKAVRKYAEFIGDINKVNNYILAYLSNDFSSLDDYTKLQITNKETIIWNHVKTNPNQFMEQCSLQINSKLAEARKYILLGLINYSVSNGLYSDAGDPTIVLGNTLKEVVSYLNSASNSNYLIKLKDSVKNIIAQRNINKTVTPTSNSSDPVVVSQDKTE
jgi:hypothetical protein